MGLLTKLHYNSDSDNRDSLANRLRQKRMAVFESFFADTFSSELKEGKTIRILDIGGTYRFWNSVGFKYLSNCEFVLLNVTDEPVPDGAKGFTGIIGDATDMKEISDSSFDLVFSNSCIEHVGKMPEWKKMASEMMRTGRYYFLQTPNRHFFMEPHFLMPWFQFLPLGIKAFILRHFRFGWFKYIKTKEEALEAADSIHLLSLKDIKELFPEGTIKRERFLGMTKSFMVMGVTCKEN